eukprot:CAMPEP_0195295890 /NCGR_PEP_ID=MMETSP0707-20130614/18269_1 /TAXON_ID=33640 /ORGANISM="Asterionellopsis glacialis, Strain CCMP134" /LENGTH=154 /DNA_ID=CAMNT_0040357227 /DNA_START=136 /DNA_END=603 /DNA_ORIENTATION=+
MLSKGRLILGGTSRAIAKVICTSTSTSSGSSRSQQLIRIAACGGRNSIGHRRYVWHSGYLDFAAAEEIAIEINVLEQRLKGLRVLDAGGGSGSTQESILASEAELHELRNKYEDVAGEPYEYEEAQHMKILTNSHGNNSHDTQQSHTPQQAPED